MHQLTASTSKLLDRRGVERIFGISKRFLEIAAMRGDGPPMIKIGRSVRYRTSDIEAWLDANTIASTSRNRAA